MKEKIILWVEYFNNADVDGLCSLYHNEAINQQVANDPVEGLLNIKMQFTSEFSNATMHCTIENIFEDGSWVIMEWHDLLGLRGCGFFKFKDDKIIFLRGYWDKLSFLQQQGLPIN